MRKLLTPIAQRVRGPSKLFINFLISLSAVGSAGFLNLLIMRSKEIKEGITLTDSHGNEVGKSKIIGKKAVISTAMTRLLMPVPPLLLPTLTFIYLEKRNLIPRNRYLKGMLDASIFFAFLSLGPPLACGVFEQTVRTNGSDLEPEFHKYKDLYYNKGL